MEIKMMIEKLSLSNKNLDKRTSKEWWFYWFW